MLDVRCWMVDIESGPGTTNWNWGLPTADCKIFLPKLPYVEKKLYLCHLLMHSQDRPKKLTFNIL